MQPYTNPGEQRGMIIDEIEKFRMDFYHKLEQQQLEQQRQLARKQKNCFHTFKPINAFVKQCSKCNYTR
jgi:predicted DNA-binding protein (UPF0251 family)